MKRETATIKVYGNFECELHRNINKSQTNMVRGFIAEWISQLLKGRLK
ncbi:MAG: hypothetical protein NDF56_04110 [archaeon GB-1845-036]|nr:hypothetical protein [Candidatus Culexmicrobium thermophilum]